MKENEAILILIEHTARDLVGSGRGISSIPSEKERKKAVQAIEKMWRKAHGYPLRESDRYNLGILGEV